MKNEIDSIFYVLGNKTRRDILSALSDEPMYFNQVSKEMRIGQQAMLRHMQTLEDVGFVNTYGEKSGLGAPDRKYYRLDSSFNLTISLSQNEFVIDYDKGEISEERLRKQLTKRFNQIPSDPGMALGTLRDHLEQIDDEIEDLQKEMYNLKAIRQTLLDKVHEIGKSNFVQLERKILYKMMRETPDSVSELSQMINENKSEVRNALKDLQNKLNRGKIKTLVEGLTA